METKRALLIGGGLDSWAVALQLDAEGTKFDLVFVDYGQACRVQELNACQRLASVLGKSLVCLHTDRLGTTNANSLLLGTGDNPIVNLRNLELIQVTALAGYTVIILALLKERGVMYPDANVTFVDNAHTMYHSAYGIYILAPYVRYDKWNFVRDANEIHDFLNSGDAHSCWLPVLGGCGTCLHCIKLKAIQQFTIEERER